MKNLLRALFIFSASILFFALNARSQAISLSAIIRPRAELMYGYKVPPDTSSKPQYIISQRTRFNADYSSDRFKAGISLQDARVWGDEVVASDVPALAVHEAWAQYNFCKQVGLKVGRQEFVYDNKRLLTDGLWIQQGRAWDAAVLKLALNKGWRVDLAGSFNQQTITFFGTYYNLANPKTLDFLWINKSKVDSAHHYKYSVSGIALGDGWQTPDTTGVNMRWTYGINSSFDHHTWGFSLEAYGQAGKTRTYNQSGFIVPDSFQTVSAYMFSANPWIAPINNFQIGIGLDYLSGSNALDSTHSGTTHMFNPQFGATHKYYGKIDIFFNLPVDTRNGGLVDGYINGKYTYKKWDFNFEYHYYALQNNVEDVENQGKALDKPLGSEFDLIVIKDITPSVNINSGLGLFFPTRSMEFVKTAAFSQIGSPTVTGVWAYIMVTFHPVFFSK